MGKPSVTNIRPPSQTTVWTPPKTSWDLNTAADQADPFYSAYGSAGFTARTNALNLSEPSGLNLTNAGLQNGDYGYIFFGVNGGMDETVIGRTDKAGILVTGNGKDQVTGGNFDDLIMTGNGKDVANGGAGDDIIFGENGADTLNGNSDNGTAVFTPGESTTVLVINDGITNLFDHDPNGESVGVSIPNNTSIRKEGIFVALDSEGHPIELEGGVPVVHVVFSVTPETSGDYTLVFNQGNQLDGPGDPSFPVDSDQLHVTLVAGQQYFFSFTYDPGHPTVRADLFAGHINVTSPINDGPGGNPGSVATSQGLPGVAGLSLFHEETIEGPPVFEFDAGDQLIGGNGPDNFIWDAADPNNVDLVWDFNQGDGTYDPLEGDVLTILGTTPYTVTDVMDLTGAGDMGITIYVGPNQAIGLVGITDIAQVTIIQPDLMP